MPAISSMLLMRATMPFEPKALPDLKTTPVLLLSGATDPIVPAASRERLAGALTAAGADVTQELVPAGHNLSQKDFAIAEKWLEHLT